MINEEINEELQEETEEKKLKNTEGANDANLIAQEEARRAIEALNLDEIDGEPVEESKPVEEDDQSFDMERDVWNADENKPAEDTEESNLEPEAEENAESEGAQEETTEVSDEEFQDLVNVKFAEVTAEDRKKLDSTIEAIKKSHPKDYDEYVEKLRKTRYYKKALEKWTKYYADIKEKCVAEVKNDIEAAAVENAKASAETANVASENVNIKTGASKDETEMSKLTPQPGGNKIVTPVPPKDNNNWTPKDIPVPPTSTPTVEDLEMKYTPIATDGLIKVDERLVKTVEGVLLNAFYESFRGAKSIDQKLSDKFVKNESDQEMLDFKKELAEKLFLVHWNMFEKDTAPSITNIEDIQKDIERHKENMNTSSIAEQFLDKLYHFDTATKQATGMIPTLAKQFAAKIQDILIANDVFEFDLTTDNVREILNRLVEESTLDRSLISKRRMPTGVADIAEILKTHIKKIENDEVRYAEGMLEKFKSKFEEIKALNPIDAENYDKLFRIVETIEACKKTLSETNTTYKTNRDVKDKLIQAKEYLSDIKAVAKSDDKTTERLNSKIRTQDKKEKHYAITDFVTIQFMKKATREFKAGNLTTFAYTDEDVEKDLSVILSKLDVNNAEKEITADTMDAMIWLINEFKVKDEAKYNEHKEKIDAYRDELTRMAGVLENETDEVKKVENQKYAKLLIADFTHLQDLQKTQSKNKLSSDKVENLNLGLVK